MKISGFTYVRNGFTFAYPFIQSIQSLLPLVDEFIIVAGDSNDGTTEALVALHDSKIKIIHTVWNDSLRAGGKIFAEQTNIGLNNITGDWGIHLQVDEVFHEDDFYKIKKAIVEANANDKIEALLFPFYHFWGNYGFIRNTRRTHRYEIRAFKNTGLVKSYKDSQGFRKYKSMAAYENGEKGQKLQVRIVDAPVYHYSYSRHPRLMKNKSNYFHRFWHNDSWLKLNTDNSIFDYNEVDKLEVFSGVHPKYMHETIAQKDWEFEYDPAKSNMRMKDRILSYFEKMFHTRFFEYRNYRLLKKD